MVWRLIRRNIGDAESWKRPTQRTHRRDFKLLVLAEWAHDAGQS